MGSRTGSGNSATNRASNSGGAISVIGAGSVRNRTGSSYSVTNRASNSGGAISVISSGGMRSRTGGSYSVTYSTLDGSCAISVIGAGGTSLKNRLTAVVTEVVFIRCAIGMLSNGSAASVIANVVKVFVCTNVRSVGGKGVNAVFTVGVCTYELCCALRGLVEVIVFGSCRALYLKGKVFILAILKECDASVVECHNELCLVKASEGERATLNGYGRGDIGIVCILSCKEDAA